MRNAMLVAIVSACSSWSACSSNAPQPADHNATPAADRSVIPPGTGWFEAIEGNTCARTCETHPGAMTASGVAPVPDCRAFAHAYCVTFHGPQNAWGGRWACQCTPAACDSLRGHLLEPGYYGAAVTDVSACSEIQ
jgi:hypothetical protein